MAEVGPSRSSQARWCLGGGQSEVARCSSEASGARTRSLTLFVFRTCPFAGFLSLSLVAIHLRRARMVLIQVAGCTKPSF